ncbi:MAG: translation initiation factor IF-2 [Phycisphaeraceae bacterium]|nr:MAG: translation initiation factor IF-2 [Phycisphaeraceae bacterium]
MLKKDRASKFKQAGAERRRMAKRVFEIAKELGVTSKAILTKCQDEGVPNMNNHMSSISAGLEATIREWFGGAEGSGGSVTAIQTAPQVDLQKVRAAPKARARAKPREPEKPAEKKEAETSAPSAPEIAPTRPDAPTRTPEAPSGDEKKVDAPGRTPAPVASKAPEIAPQREGDTTSTKRTDSDREDEGTDARKAAPDADGPDEADGGTPPGREKLSQPVMNVPRRPESVSPAGPTLDATKPARLSGPKVVRVEAPDPVSSPRSRRPQSDAMPMNRGPRSGAGAGVGPGRGGPGAMGGDEESGRGSRRNKRRAGPAGARRSARGGGGGGAGAGVPESSPGANWRQQDLVEREARLSRAGGFLRQRRRDMKKRETTGGERAQPAAATGGVVKIAEPFTIKDLSSTTGVKASEIIKKLFMQGVMATVNSGIDAEKAQEIMLEYNIELEVEEEKTAEQVVKEEFASREAVDERPRHPVVTILGHVDHGKTSLLDRIRNAKVAEGEAGGITQATSAFRVPVNVGDEDKQVVFLDTPGHEAFTSMRARGAKVTDIVVLVVAADDGVMPQTVESISHAKAAGVPIVVALNKIDRPEASDTNIQKVFGQLAEHGLNPAEWGGDTEVVRTSAITGQGVDELLETLDYQAQLLELKADFGGAARGSVIESRMIEGRGPVANILIQDGLLKIGDFIVIGRGYGRVRDITNDRSQRIREAHPADPVQISGIDELPDAGDKFYVVGSLKKAQEAAEQRRDRDRERELAQPKVTLETMFSQMEAAKIKELTVVIKADVQGSVDVLRKSAEDITTEDVRVRALHAAVGGITESDVLLADASRAVIIGFNVIPSGKARQLAEQKGVQIRTYQVIYDIVDDLKKAAEGLLEPDVREDILGHADVRAVFKVSKVGAIAGCYVTDGTVERNALIRVTRGGIIVENNRTLEQLKRFKDDAKEVRAGQECGMKIAGYDDIKEGDVLECYRRVEVKRTL